MLTVVFFLLNAPATNDGEEFFEKKIRPVLVTHCYECHSTQAIARKKWRGGLLVDSREGLRKGGDSGPAINAKNPSQSLLLATLTHTGDIQMPPSGKLSEAIIADFRRWLEMGAPDPRTESLAKPRLVTSVSLREFWSYQPIKKTNVPEVSNANWPDNDIDRFILSRLESTGLSPNHEADKPTLLRRLFFDLAGLPPTESDLEEFVQDNRPDAYERWVDRLLSSPAFGERWGRHYLDVVRFGESLTLRGFLLTDAWRYRDYVIQSFAQDRPFDQFLQEQIAGDLLPADSLDQRRQQLIATTFLMLGNTNLEEQDKRLLEMDVVDEQIDTIGKAFLGQTIGCARCHDHKFDPISTRDYYALAGVFKNVQSLKHSNVSELLIRPLPMEANAERLVEKHQAKLAEVQQKLNRVIGKIGAVQASIIPLTAVSGIVVDDTQAERVGEWTRSTFQKSYIGTGYLHDGNSEKGKKTVTFQPKGLESGRYEVRLAYTHGGNRAENVPVTVFSSDGEKEIRVNMKKAPSIDGHWISLGEFRFEKAGFSHVIVSNEGTNGHVIADAVQYLSLDSVPSSRMAQKSASSTKANPEQAELQAELQKLKDSMPPRDMVLSAKDADSIADLAIHVRGSPHQLGPVVPRGVLWMDPRTPVSIPKNESGRRQVAEWIASANNPLTARVWVNRCWHWLFGAGLVRTTDNFGSTGDRPSHPELLDTLAHRFIQQGWSTKHLVRTIVLSKTYKMSSQVSQRDIQARLDPENRLLSRMNRRVLDAECLRDAMLVVSGELNRKMGGRTFEAKRSSDYGFDHDHVRRTVYTPVFRNAPEPLSRVFDAADSSSVVGTRDVSIVAPQALFLMNDDLVIQRSRAAAIRLLRDMDSTHDGVERAWLRTLGRTPTSAERSAVVGSLDGKDARSIKTWETVFQALFATPDFRFVD